MTVNLDNRTTAIGLARYAKEYLEAAIVVDEELGVKRSASHISPIPAYFLLTHAIELTLKAYLRGAGLAVRQLQGVGHDLDALLAKANELGLGDCHTFTADDNEAFSLLVAANGQHRFRYIQTGATQLPFWSVAAPLAIRLHKSVAPKVGYKSLSISFPEKRPVPAMPAEEALLSAMSSGGNFTIEEVHKRKS